MLLDLIMQRKNFILECFSIQLPLQVEEAFAFWGTPEGDLIHPAAVLETVRRHRVNVDGNVCTVMVTTLVLEAEIETHAQPGSL
ncbi:unnamed protein product [Prunus armeniaca]